MESDPKSSLPSLDAALKGAWRTLERRLRLLNGFGLLIYFVRTPRLMLLLREQLNRHLSASGKTLALITIDHPEGFARVAMAELSKVFGSTSVGACWLEMQRNEVPAAWDAPRRELLMRMNERRGRLESELPCPLILLLPEEGAREVAQTAPDLWDIRILAETLAARVEPVEDTLELREFTGPGCRLIPGFQDDQVHEPVVDRALAGWAEQWNLAFDAVPASALDVDHPHLDAIALRDGFSAIDLCIRHGRLEQADQVAEEALTVAGLRVRRAEEPVRAALIEELASAWMWLGEVSKYINRKQASHALREAVALRRRLVTTEEQLPAGLPSQWTRDELCRTLQLQAEIELLEGGDVEVAERSLREILGLSCEDGAGEVRQRWMALLTLGRLQFMQGHSGEAVQTHRECLRYVDRLLAEMPGAWVPLHDRWLTLLGLGQALLLDSRAAEAAQAFAEALPLARSLVQTAPPGVGPASQSGLAQTLVSLAQYGDPTRAGEHLAEAATIYDSLTQRCPTESRYSDRLKRVLALLSDIGSGHDASASVRTD